MKTSKRVGLTLAAALLAGGLLTANSKAADSLGPQGAEFGHRRLLQRAKEQLGITDEQSAQIRAVLKEDKENLMSLIARLHDARAALRESIHANGANESSVRAASAKVATVEADLAVERLKLYGKISPILTVDQRQKISDFQARMDEVLDHAINHFGERLAQ